MTPSYSHKLPFHHTRGEMREKIPVECTLPPQTSLPCRAAAIFIGWLVAFRQLQLTTKTSLPPAVCVCTAHTYFSLAWCGGREHCAVRATKPKRYTHTHTHNVRRSIHMWEPQRVSVLCCFKAPGAHAMQCNDLCGVFCYSSKIWCVP